jgi:hypothetical protein
MPDGLTVEGASEVTGPYARVSAYVFDADRQAIRVEATPAHRFLRVRSAVSLHLESSVEGGQVYVAYDLQPTQVELWSSARVEGPYAREAGPSVDLADRSLSIPRWGQARFFRLRGDAPVRMTGLEWRGEDVVIRYTLP